MSTKLIKIGVFGAGHLGKIHLKLINESKFLDAFKINNLVGIIVVLGFVLEITLLK